MSYVVKFAEGKFGRGISITWFTNSFTKNTLENRKRDWIFMTVDYKNNGENRPTHFSPAAAKTEPGQKDVHQPLGSLVKAPYRLTYSRSG